MPLRLKLVVLIANLWVVAIWHQLDHSDFIPPLHTNWRLLIFRHGDDSFLLAAILVVAILFVDIFILFLLKHIGGPFRSDVQLVFRKYGGKVTIASIGLIGSFLAIAIVAFAAVMLLGHFINSN